MQLANPHYLWLFLVFIPIIIWYIRIIPRSNASLGVSTLQPLAKMPRSWKVYLLHLCFLFKLLAIACLIIVLCRPQKQDSWSSSSVYGSDLVIAMDISGSMLARDFKPDRFEAAKEVAKKFIAGRESDNIGVVIFAGESFTAVPMTNDRAVLSNYINDIKMGMITDGTAIGDGLATSINRIREGKAKSKAIILLTDGSNNTGVVAPLTAAEIAKKYGIKVYTIGIGTNGNALFPQQNAFGRIEYVPMPVVIDEVTLRKIASTTGGKYFRATDNKALSEIFAQIDSMEKTKLDVHNYSATEDDYMLWMALAIGLFALSIILRHSIVRTIP